jgi:hypothetical protein
VRSLPDLLKATRAEPDAVVDLIQPDADILVPLAFSVASRTR